MLMVRRTEDEGSRPTFVNKLWSSIKKNWLCLGMLVMRKWGVDYWSREREDFSQPSLKYFQKAIRFIWTLFRLCNSEGVGGSNEKDNVSFAFFRMLQPNGNLDVLCLNRGTPKRCLDLSNLSSGEMSATPLTTSTDFDETGREKGGKVLKGNNF